MIEEVHRFPVVFTRALVVYPQMSVVLTVGRGFTRETIELAQREYNEHFVTVPQRRAEDTSVADLNEVFNIGTKCKIEKAVSLSDGGMQIYVKGIDRFEVSAIEWQGDIGFVSGNILTPTNSNSKKSLDRERVTGLFSPVVLEKQNKDLSNKFAALKRATSSWEFISGCFELLSDLQQHRDAPVQASAIPWIERKNEEEIRQINIATEEQHKLLSTEEFEEQMKILTSIVESQLSRL